MKTIMKGFIKRLAGWILLGIHVVDFSNTAVIMDFP